MNNWLAPNLKSVFIFCGFSSLGAEYSAKLLTLMAKREDSQTKF